MKKEVDYIIVGGGLAATVLAHHLLFRNQKIVILHDDTLASSSSVAAGLYNPMTGKKLLKGWMTELIFPYLVDFYKKVEHTLGQQYLFEKNIICPIKSIEDLNTLQGKTADDGFIQVKTFAPDQALILNNPLGTYTSNYCGYLDVAGFAKSSLAYFNQLGITQKSIVDYKAIDFNNDEGVTYNDLLAKKIIFCEGIHALQNPYFNWITFVPNKGEILDLQLDNVHTDYVSKDKVFLIQKPDGGYKCGSTYDREDLELKITEAAKLEICASLDQMIQLPYQVVAQHVGIRPATHDRKPVLGSHPQYKKLIIFNGLGSKGVSLAPYFANELSSHLINGKAILKEVSTQRFYKRYVSSF